MYCTQSSPARSSHPGSPILQPATGLGLGSVQGYNSIYIHTHTQSSIRVNLIITTQFIRGPVDYSNPAANNPIK